MSAFQIEFLKSQAAGFASMVRSYESDVRHYEHEIKHARTPEELNKALERLTSSYKVIISSKVAEASLLAELNFLEKVKG